MRPKVLFCTAPHGYKKQFSGNKDCLKRQFYQKTNIYYHNIKFCALEAVLYQIDTISLWMAEFGKVGDGEGWVDLIRKFCPKVLPVISIQSWRICVEGIWRRGIILFPFFYGIQIREIELLCDFYGRIDIYNTQLDILFHCISSKGSLCSVNKVSSQLQFRKLNYITMTWQDGAACGGLLGSLCRIEFIQIFHEY